MHLATLFLTVTFSKIMSNFVDPTPPNSVQQQLSFLLLFCFVAAEGFDDRGMLLMEFFWKLN